MTGLQRLAFAQTKHVKCCIWLIFSGLWGVDPLRKPIILLPGAVPLLALLFFFLLVFAVAVGWMGPGGWEGGRPFFYTKSRLSGHPNRRCEDSWQ